jgi:hypothetical protein
MTQRLLFILAILLSGLSAENKATGQDTDAAQSETMLVLISGRVISGQITPRPDGYDVSLDAGRIFVPSRSIRFRATGIEDAYIKMRESLPERTPNEHIALARWCLTNKLNDKARRELLDALHLDPYRDDAKRMLNSLVRSEQLAVQQAEERARKAVQDRSGSPIYSLTNQPDVQGRSLGGLSRPLARAFTTTVQPLVSNKCGNATCHGGGVQRDFQIQVIRDRSHPTLAEQNLAAILNQLNFESPADSPLLRYAETSHGGIRVPVFRGRNGATQLDALRQWVYEACEDIAPAARPVQPLATATASVPEHSEIHSEISQDLSRPSVAAAPTDKAYGPFGPKSAIDIPATADKPLRGEFVSHGVPVDTSFTDRRFLKQARDANRFDVFDPAAFNQQFHAQRLNSEQPDTTHNQPVAGDQTAIQPITTSSPTASVSQ